ncbi:hypothetical protein ACHAXN_012400 [Cyclotella atomus]
MAAPRKLTASETSTLRSLLLKQLDVAGHPQAEEDAGDLLDYAFAMIANGKDVDYVVEELISMEMEVCDADKARKLGDALSAFFAGMAAAAVGSGGGETKPNALTASGALGSSRERGSGQQRTLHGAAFDRLRSQPPPQAMGRGRGNIRGSRDGGRGRGPEDFRGGRGRNDSRGRGRDDRDFRGGGGGPGGRDGRGSQTGGRRMGRGDVFQQYDQHQGRRDFGRGGRGGFRGGIDTQGGRFGGRDFQDNKRKRFDEQQSVQEVHNYNGGYDNSGRGFRGGRGRGRGPGRFNSDDTDFNSNNKPKTATEEAAAVSESPLVADSFGYSGRGRGRGRGSGRGGREERAGRDEVAEMVAAKTWKRPRTMDEGLSTSR